MCRPVEFGLACSEGLVGLSPWRRPFQLALHLIVSFKYNTKQPQRQNLSSQGVIFEIDLLKWLMPIIQMSSNKFLQRFQGKIQVVSKEGVHNVFGGGKNDNVVVYTNNNFNPQPKNKTSSSLNKPKPQQQETPKDKRNSLKKVPQNIEKRVTKNLVPPAPKEKKPENPFLVSNPFYLDEEDKMKVENERKERQQHEKELERQIQMQAKDSKKTTTVSLNRSLDKKKTEKEKEWTKLGGLGANIGGDEWLEKKKKLDKMQQFSEQVKMINKDRPNVPKPNQKDERREVNARQKAMEYSKNVPKPPVRSAIQKVEEPEEKEEVENQLSELQQYEMRHEQLKNMLRNQW